MDQRIGLSNSNYCMEL